MKGPRRQYGRTRGLRVPSATARAKASLYSIRARSARSGNRVMVWIYGLELKLTTRVKVRLQPTLP